MQNILFKRCKRCEACAQKEYKNVSIEVHDRVQTYLLQCRVMTRQAQNMMKDDSYDENTYANIR